MGEAFRHETVGLFLQTVPKPRQSFASKPSRQYPVGKGSRQQQAFISALTCNRKAVDA